MNPWLWLWGGLTAASCAYYLAVIFAGRRFRRALQRAPVTRNRPPVSILKPLRGVDARLAENLRSHAELDYPAYELVFGVADPADPALEKVEELRAAYPQLPMQVHVCGVASEGNAKVALLEELAAAAKHDVLLVDDGDIRLAPADLARLADELTPEVGLVSTLYRAQPGGTAASGFDALWISSDFPGQALTGAYLAGLSFALGAAMLFRKTDLERIGGFAAIRPYLADDYELGRRVAELGRPVRLSSVVVETVLGSPGWGEVWRRHLRWSRTIRASRPGGHAGFGVTFGSLWAALLWATGGPVWPLAVAVCGRIAASAHTAALLQARLGWKPLAAPLGELWSAAVWLWSFTGREVVWRGRRLRLDGHGRITGRLN